MTIAETGRLARGESLLLPKISKEKSSEIGKRREAERRLKREAKQISLNWKQK